MSINSGKIIKQRIKSVLVTSKMTKAMQMIAAVNMRKAVDRKVAARPFTYAAWKILAHLVRDDDEAVKKSVYLREREGNKTLIVLLASNRGLCGGFHSNLERRVRQYMNKYEGREFSAIVIGRKGEKIAKKLSIPMVASFTNLESTITRANRTAIFQVMQEEFLNKKVDRVVIIYTDHMNTMTQVPRVRQVMPLNITDLQDILEIIARKEGREADKNQSKIDYLMEPNKAQVVDEVVPLLIRAHLYHALLENKAASESARMMAMQKATDAAEEMVETLTLAYNQVRQAKITNEIAEIAASKAALE
ncbi:ATP synthase F1 subunit gamma [Microgenomates group bacterium]|nr:ATP synthase F1 subunit gamma [Microgenomates group bacterium]